MKYTLSEEIKNNKLKTFYRSISTNYAIAILVFSYVLYVNWGDSTLRITLISCIAMFPLSALLFAKNIKSKLSTTYELTEKELIIDEGTKQKRTIPFREIENLKETKHGFSFKYNNSQLYILQGINDEGKFIEELSKKTN